MKIHVAGHRGRVGSAIMRRLEAWRAANEYLEILIRTHAELGTLLGDPLKARQQQGWAPQITACEMCAEMVAEDLRVAQRHALPKVHGMELPVAVEG